MGSVDISIIAESDTINTNTYVLEKNGLSFIGDHLGFNLVGVRPHVDNDPRRPVHSFDLNTFDARDQRILNAVNSRDKGALRTAIRPFTNRFQRDALIVVTYPNNLGDLFVQGQGAIRPFRDPRTRGFKTLASLVRAYRLNGLVKLNPYVNFNDNDTGRVNCVTTWIKQNYNRISNKAIDKHFGKEINAGMIESFCKNYKIPMNIMNIAGETLLENDFEHNKNHIRFNAIIANNHLYPQKGSYTKKPTFNSKKLNLKDLDNNLITITTNNMTHTSNGSYKEIGESTLDKTFFTGIPPNFFYESEEDLQSKALLYYSKYDSKFEVDLNKAYFSMAYVKMPEEFTDYPIFSSSEIVKSHPVSRPIDSLCYYILSDKVKKIKGIQTNCMYGFFVKELMENHNVLPEDILYYRKYSYLAKWSKVVDRISDLMEEYGDSTTKDFVFYNGCLGRVRSPLNTTKISNVKKTDNILLENYRRLDSQNYTTFKKEDTRKYRYLNTRNIYNLIVDFTNLYLLKTLNEIQELNPGIILTKIKTDSLGFLSKPEGDWNNTNEYLKKKYYKWVTDINPNLQADSFDMVDGKEVKGNTIKELSCFDGNKSYFGPPGTGKTELVKGNEEFNLPGHNYDFAVTTTNVCARNINGETIYSTLRLFSPEEVYKSFRKFKDTCIWIDEFSMLPKHIWNYIFILSKEFNVKFIISGDINQIGPIGERKMNVKDIFFKHLMGDNTVLTIDYRNDPEIVELRDKVLNCDEFQLHGLFKKTKSDYTKYDRHLSFYKATAKAVNLNILKKRKLKYLRQDGEWVISDGVILRARVSKKKLGIYKGDVWKKEGECLINLTNGTVMDIVGCTLDYFTLGYCITTHSSQGLTISDDLVIHDICGMITQNTDILYTAITRGKKFKNLHYVYKGDRTDKKIPMAWIDHDDDETSYEKYDKLKAV